MRGYAELRETLADPTHEDHAQMLEWLGIETAAQFDPHAFDTDEVNAVLGGRAGVAYARPERAAARHVGRSGCTASHVDAVAANR